MDSDNIIPTVSSVRIFFRFDNYQLYLKQIGLTNDEIHKIYLKDSVTFSKKDEKSQDVIRQIELGL